MNLSCLSEIYFYQLKPYLSFACQGDLSVEPWFIAAEFYRVCGYFNRPDSLRFLRATNLDLRDNAKVITAESGEAVSSRVGRHQVKFTPRASIGILVSELWPQWGASYCVGGLCSRVTDRPSWRERLRDDGNGKWTKLLAGTGQRCSEHVVR